MGRRSPGNHVRRLLPHPRNRSFQNINWAAAWKRETRSHESAQPETGPRKFVPEQRSVEKIEVGPNLPTLLGVMQVTACLWGHLEATRSVIQEPTAVYSGSRADRVDVGEYGEQAIRPIGSLILPKIEHNPTQ